MSNVSVGLQAVYELRDALATAGGEVYIPPQAGHHSNSDLILDRKIPVEVKHVLSGIQAGQVRPSKYNTLVIWHRQTERGLIPDGKRWLVIPAYMVVVLASEAAGAHGILPYTCFALGGLLRKLDGFSCPSGKLRARIWEAWCKSEQHPFRTLMVEFEQDIRKLRSDFDARIAVALATQRTG